MKNVSQVIRIIREINPQISMSDENLLKAEYLDIGLIDSLQLIKMVVSLEKEFDMRFSHEELESKDFRTLKGVYSIIEKRMKTGKREGKTA